MDESNVDDPAPTLGLHYRPGIFGQQEGPSEHQGDHVFPSLLGEGLEGLDVLVAGVVHQDVDGSVGFQGSIDEQPAASLLAQISLDGKTSHTARCITPSFRLDITNHYLGAAGSQMLGNSQARAAGATGHNRGAAAQRIV
jgi:hypothetical protein